MKNSIRNLRLVFSQWKSWIIFAIATALFLRLSFAFFNYRLSLGNLGKFITYSEITFNILLALLFGIFLAGQIYKIVMMQGKKRVHKRGFLGGILGVLITGCPSCTIGVASFLGVGSLLSLLPWQ
jgi:hypothetical protein